MFSKKDIERYYDLSEIHYRVFWDLDKSSSLHYGYWDASTKNFHEALLNINKILSQKIKINKDDIVLDAGCGIGGSSVWLATNIGCNVTGISLSNKQVNTANDRAVKNGVENFATFYQKDFTDTDFENESFSVAWAIESVCHAQDKSQFINETFRLLNKGGRLVLADFFKKENLQGKDAEQIQLWADGWAVPDFSTVEQFEKQLKQAGFINIKIEDASQNIWRSVKRLYRAYYAGKVLGFLYGLIKPNASKEGKRNIETAFYQYKTFKKNLWKYLIITAEKL
jgi:cyclopropane fatty-acyl-phospholipid synthase-like methyltransferase